ncbi:MAG: helix-turn-helix domain-containing protein [Chloroflexi bacterium]|nr:helix-turn-helix domain-containing protein [Chloroflexota bacterium]
MIANEGSMESAQGMLTIPEVAVLLHVHPNTVRLWSNKGLLRAYRLGFRRDRRFRPEDIDAFLRAGGNGGDGGFNGGNGRNHGGNGGASQNS